MTVNYNTTVFSCWSKQTLFEYLPLLTILSQLFTLILSSRSKVELWSRLLYLLHLGYCFSYLYCSLLILCDVSPKSIWPCIWMFVWHFCIWKYKTLKIYIFEVNNALELRSFNLSNLLVWWLVCLENALVLKHIIMHKQENNDKNLSKSNKKVYTDRHTLRQ